MSESVAIGLDLSLTATGIASSRGWTDLIRYPGKFRGHDRLAWICATITEHVVDSVALVVVEGPSYGNQGSSRQSGHHERAGLWWMVTHSLWRRGINFAVASPASRAKYATGRGNAAKADVVREVTRRFNWFEGGEDEADALVLAAMGADRMGHPMAAMPVEHRSALDAVQWPDALSASVAAEHPLAGRPGCAERRQGLSGAHPDRDTWPTVGQL